MRQKHRGSGREEFTRTGRGRVLEPGVISAVWSPIAAAPFAIAHVSPGAMRLPALLIATALVVLGMLALTGCTRTSSSPEEQEARDQERQITQLQDWNQRLLVAGRQKDDRLRSMTRLVYKMIDDVAGVSTRQGLVRGIRVDQPVYLQSEFPRTERSIRAAERQFLMYLSVLESTLQEGEQKVERLRHQQEEEAPTPDLSGVVASLREELTEAEAHAERWTTVVDSLSYLADSLRHHQADVEKEKRTLLSTVSSLRQAYVLAESPATLEAKGVIDKRFLRTSSLRSIPTDLFDEVTVETTVVPFVGRAATMLSTHRHAPELYTIEPGRLLIHDPDAFWALSRYVVLEVDG